MDNVVDLYWPVPLVGRSGLPMQPVLRELMWRFDTNAHPSMSEFVSTIRSADKYSQYDRVAKGREQAPVHQPANLFTVPAAYFTFAYVAPIV